MKIINIKSGDVYGRLTLLREVDRRVSSNGREHRVFLCRCLCGKETSVTINHLRSGGTTSCGCYQREKIISGQAKKYKNTLRKDNKETYITWCGMRSRCGDKKDRRYGGRGISVCKEWNNSFQNFITDMGKKPEGLSLDRIDNNGNYCKENCRWATMREQANNRSSNRLIEYKGEKLSLSEWSRRLVGNTGLVLSRIEDGWNLIKAVSTPKIIR